MAQTSDANTPSAAGSDRWHPVTPRGAGLIAAIAADPPGALLAMDFDGTLAPIVDDPTQAHVHPGARAALLRLTELIGSVAVITGRPVEVVRRLAAIEPGTPITVLGQYGVERWSALNDEMDLPPLPPGIDAARDELLDLIAGPLDQVSMDGVRLEDKGRALALHTRRASEPEAAWEALRDPVTQTAAVHGLHVEPGRLVWELRGGGVTKGAALSQLAAERGAATIVMCGDDLGDLAAFDAVDALVADGAAGGVVVSATLEQPRVAERADVWCDGVPGLAAWLGTLVERLDAREADR